MYIGMKAGYIFTFSRNATTVIVSELWKQLHLSTVAQISIFKIIPVCFDIKGPAALRLKYSPHLSRGVKKSLTNQRVYIYYELHET